MGYSIKHRDWIYFKGNVFFFFCKNINKNVQNIGKNITNNISDKYSKKLPDTGVKHIK